MKKWGLILCVMMMGLLYAPRVSAQATELAQLALNIEKLNQFRQILSDMKRGYEILTGGYNTVKNIAEGNFKLHEVFLDGLTKVSPAVKRYKKVGDIISYQVRIVKEYKAALGRFRSSDRFRPEELDYFSKIYNRLTSESLGNLDDITVIVTAGNLRMSDEERLKAIDAIYDDITDKYRFLKVFNQQIEVLRIQRGKEAGDVKVLKNLYK